MKKIFFLSFIFSEMTVAQSITLNPINNGNSDIISAKMSINNVVSIEAIADQVISVPGNAKLKISGESYYLSGFTDIQGSTQSIEFANLSVPRWTIRDFREAGTFPIPVNTNAFQIVNNIGFGTIPFQINKADDFVTIQKLNYPNNAALGKVLTSDAIGNVSWQPTAGNWREIGSNSAQGGFNNNITDGTSNTILIGEGNSQSAGKYLYGMGWGLKLNGYSNTVLGAFNSVPTGSNTTWVATDPLFLIGNGQSDINRSTALTILKNGNMGIGTNSPSKKLHISDGESGSSSSNFSHLVRIENDDDAFVSIAVPADKKAGIQFLKASSTEYPDQFIGSIRLTETNTFDFRLGTNTTKMRLDQLGNLRIGMSSTDGCLSDGNGTILAGTCVSDSRYKKNIRSFNPLLDDLIKLNPVNFDWKTEEFPDKGFGNEQSYGFIAQEVEQIFPELVKTDEKGFKAVNYSKLNIMSIQAIKELKAENDDLKALIRSIQKDVEVLKASINSGIGK